MGQMFKLKWKSRGNFVNDVLLEKLLLNGKHNIQYTYIIVYATV